ncbi:MAG: glycosyltransferase family A protein [Bdellovibrionota bacterium]
MAESSPKISVIVPTYNRPELLREALGSLARQTFTDFEAVVVNDAGVPIRAIVDELRASLPAIVTIDHSENRGLPAARNTAVNASHGEFLAYLDDDDLFHPEHLQLLLEAATITHGIWYSDRYDVWLTEKEGRRSETKRELAVSPEYDPDLLLFENLTSVPCFFHPRRYFDEVGGFDEHLTALEDWDLWVRISRRHQFFHLNRATCDVRRFVQLDSFLGDHQHGYAWATLNAIHKYFPYVHNRPDVLSRYKNKLSEALEHLTILVLQSIPDHQPLKVAFGRHSPETVLERLDYLEAAYASDGAAFAELRGILHVYRNDFESALVSLAHAISLDPSRVRAKDLFEYLQNNVGRRDKMP